MCHGCSRASNHGTSVSYIYDLQVHYSTKFDKPASFLLQSRTVNLENPDISLLLELLQIDSPSGDEAPIADWLESWIPDNVINPEIQRYGDSLIVSRGKRPDVALFAHIDTTGFTLGYGSSLIPIGGPAVVSGDGVRPAGQSGSEATLEVRSGEWLLKGAAAAPGSRYVYSAAPEYDTKSIRSPYLDNRAGVYSALQCLLQCNNIAVAFTTGEEHSGNGATVCAGMLYRDFGITQALISDITWDTEYIKCGQGVAISLRDRMVPRQRFLDQVLKIAEESGIPFQREIESAGGSDGGYIQRSGHPIDWVFVGAPEKGPHTAREEIVFSDLESMTEMLAALVRGLKKETEG